ncbi:hypothetical protein ABT173_03890 [Streptomyces sp. NPDC001795]|uniref:hypothetical protein n=1 Tax=Streptomyces sp. NPDC001795 TaxID=3154525 RepID=UPI0033316552
MSWEQQPGDGAYGANAANNATGAHTADGVHQGSGPSQGPPNVYRPYAEATPEYEQYADPAAAHGWQNAYDETQQLPPVPGGPGPSASRPEGGSHRRARPAPHRFRIPRGAAVAVGALGAVGIAVALAGAFGSGSSGAPGGAPGSAGPKTASTDSAPASTEPSAAVDPATGTGASPTAGAAQSASPAQSATSATPSTARPPSAYPSEATSASVPGNSDGKPGRGHSKRPK